MTQNLIHVKYTKLVIAIVAVLTVLVNLPVIGQTHTRISTPNLDLFNFVSCDTLRSQNQVGLLKLAGSNTHVKGDFYLQSNVASTGNQQVRDALDRNDPDTANVWWAHW